MGTEFSRLTEAERCDLDALLEPRGNSWWDNFYADRAKPCPFFVPHPDENLAEWLDEGRIRRGRAIDIGCGNGRNAIHLARHGFSVEALDHSKAAIEWTKERAAEAHVVLSLIHASVFDVDLGTAKYDLVYDSGCFHHIPPHRRAQYVERAIAALVPGGWFCMTCFRPEGGSRYSDAEVYERRSMGGGLGYTEEQLRNFWSEGLQIRVLRQMRAQDALNERFGESFLWVLLGQKDGP